MSLRHLHLFLKTLPVCAAAVLALSGALSAQPPSSLSYQGRVAVDGTNFHGLGQFKFVLTNAAGSTTLWSNDGTSSNGGEPTAAVALNVTKGLYSVGLGDVALANMTPVPAAIFGQAGLRLRVWFNDGVHGFQLLTPDQPLSAVGFALLAGNVPDGAITSAQLAPGAVGSASLAPGVLGRPQVTSSASVAAVSNTSYLATGDVRATFTLPSSPRIGDTLQVTGAGPGGWQIPNPNWVARESDRHWVAGAVSADGLRAFALVDDGPIYRSLDGGLTWAAQGPVRPWKSIATSADGLRLIATSYQAPGGRVHLSQDGGFSWTELVLEDQNWLRAVASSADGQKLVVGSDGFNVGGYLFTSTDGGQSWTRRMGDTPRRWTSIASSADGTRLVAADRGLYAGSNLPNAGQIYVSIDSGVTWAPATSARDWSSISCSQDGQKILASVNAGFLYVSLDGGTNWQERESARPWTSVHVSRDGSTMYAVSEFGQPVRKSVDDGVTWTTEGPAGILTAVTASADGQRVFVLSENNSIFVKGLGFAGEAGSSIDLHYVGGGLWQPAAAAFVAPGAVGSAQLAPSAVTAPALAAGAVGTAQLATGAVGPAQLAAGAVGSAQLAAGAVGATELALGAVGSAQLAAGAVGTNELALGAVGSAQLAAGSVGTGQLADGAVSTGQLADGGVTGAKLAPGAIGTAQLADGAVTAAKLAPGAVGSLQLTAGAVGPAQLADGSVTTAKLAAGGVGSAQLADGSVTTAKLAVGGVGSEQLADGSVTTAKLAAGGVGSAQLADGSVTTAKLAVGGVSSAQLADGSVNSAKLASGAVATAQIADNSITSTKLTAGSVGTGALATGAVNNSRMSADAVNTAQLVDASVTGAKLATGAVSTAKLADAGVTGAKLAAGAVSTGQLADGGVTSVKLAAGAVGSAQLADGGVTSAKLAAGAVGPAQLASDLSLSGTVSVNGTVLIDPNGTAGTGPTPGLLFGATGSGEAISSRRLNGTGQFGLNFFTANLLRMTISNVGNVGIGTSNPTLARLQVGGSVSTSLSYGYLNSTGSIGTAGPSSVPLSIHATDRVAASEFNAFSDERIKTIRGVSDSAQDLRTLRQLEITDYTFRDQLARGDRPQKKVVAQQVERVFPQAVSRLTDVVPDIFRAATLLADGWIELSTDLRVGERVKLVSGHEQAVHEVLEVRPGAFRTALRPSGSESRVFVYGREVQDFRTVDYEAIAMLNVSATQELARQIESLRAELADLRRERAAARSLPVAAVSR